MQIKRALLFGLLTAFLATAQTPLSKEAKIDRMLTLTNASSMIDQMFAQIRKMTEGMMPPGATPEQAAEAKQVQQKVQDVVHSRLSWDRMRPQFIKIYSETFTDEELDGLLAFYDSPTGRAMIKKTPELMAKSMAIGQAQMVDILPEIQRIVAEGAKK